MSSKTRIVVFVGSKGRGSNMQTVIDGTRSGYIPGEVVGVIGTAEGSAALQRASDQGIPIYVVPFDPEFSGKVATVLNELDPGLIVLGGFLRQLPEDIVKRFHHQIINIHPALIPSFCGHGMYGHHVHEAVIEHGVKVSGVTVHFVDECYDTGPIIMQRVVPVLPDDDADVLAARVLAEEHKALPECVKLFAESKLTVKGRTVFIAD